MPYKVRFRESAKEEYETCCKTYPNIRDILSAQLEALADEAEKNKHESSLDLNKILPEDIDDLKRLVNGSDIKLSWEKFKESGFWEKIKACLIIVKKRRPPWELRCSDFLFTYSEIVPFEFLIVYELDHVNKELVVTLLDGPFTP
jgi:hypothetical protein